MNTAFLFVDYAVCLKSTGLTAKSVDHDYTAPLV